MNYPGASGATVPVASSLSGQSLEKGDSIYLFGVLAAGATQLPINDTNAGYEAASALAIQPSISVNIQGAAEVQPAPGISVEISFPSAPGAGESIAIQEADTDADAFYTTPTNATYTIGTFTTSASGVVVARGDFIPTGGKFMRAQRTKGANAVGCKVKFSRLA